MQNKNILVVFTVLLALATLYTLSFNWVASGYEATADEYGAYVADSLEMAGALGDQTFDEAAAQAAREFLRDSATAEIYPVFGHTYRQVKEQELNLGLDLKGGMSVTLEVSLPDLIVALSDYSDNADFRGAIADAKALRKENSDDFVTNFESAWTARAPEVELWRIFHNMENKDLFPAKSTDAEIFEISVRKPKPPSTTPKASSASVSTSSAWPSPTCRSSKTVASLWNFLASTTASVRASS